MLNQTVRLTLLVAALSGCVLTSSAYAQNVDQIRWKSENQVREILGDPQTITPPVGTHATYTLWKYDGFTVAFANSKAFHLYRTDRMRKMQLDEERPTS